VARSLGGDGVPGNGDALDQDFALVVSNAQEQAASPVLVQGGVTVDDTQNGQNGDGALEPGESFELQQGVRNTGTDVATGVTASLSGASGLNIEQADSAYDDITADAEQQNLTPYEATLSGATACGVDATGILDVTSAEGGVQPVPVTIPTGRPGPPTTHTKTQTIAIPDDNAGGVQSTLSVPVSGRIKDLDVTLNVSHSFVGDLKVELTSPDNSTTVRLIEHVGGPNNGGNDLVDTVFDDEASTAIGAGASIAPYTGSFKPQGDQLARFDGKEQQGAWKLRVSDRYENDTGSLMGWGLTIRTAQCDPDVNAPETEIQAAPPPLASTRNASFEFGSPRPGSMFQCRLDGGDFSPCASPQAFGNLPEGNHTFEVRAFDSHGNVDGSPALWSWTVDVTAPALQIASAAGATPVVRGMAGTSSGDKSTVTVNLFAGSSAAGSPAQTVVASRDASGVFTAQFAHVGNGTYTATARQQDAAGNTGASAPVTFDVGATATGPAAPDFAVVALEESLADAAAGRLTALSSCDGACSRTTSLVVSPRSASKLRVPRKGNRPVRLGGSKKGAGTGGVKVGMTKKTRRTLKRSHATATGILSAVAGSAKLSRTITMRPELKPARIAKRGLKLAGVCSSQCTMSARLIVSASTARRLGLRTSGGSVAIGSGRVTAGSAAKTFTVRITRSMRAALSRAKGAALTLEVNVDAPGAATRRATRRITLG
jgi:subtilisin-like proprotein convertase family protein